MHHIGLEVGDGIGQLGEGRLEDVEWEVPRILRELKSDRMVDFYAQEVAQVNTTNWVKGRVVLLGDAGYCPSPITGQGTTLAFIGAVSIPLVNIRTNRLTDLVPKNKIRTLAV